MRPIDGYLHFPDPLPEPGSTARSDGYCAFMAGRLLNENPHTFGSADNREWAAGWIEADGEEGEDADE